MLGLLLLPFRLLLGLFALVGTLVLLPFRLFFSLTFSVIMIIGVVFLFGAILSFVFLAGLAPGIFLFIVGLAVLRSAWH